MLRSATGQPSAWVRVWVLSWASAWLTVEGWWLMLRLPHRWAWVSGLAWRPVLASASVWPLEPERASEAVRWPVFPLGPARLWLWAQGLVMGQLPEGGLGKGPVWAC